MNSTLTTAPGRHEHPPQPQVETEVRPIRRITGLDRIALHVGLALITWGRRSRSVPSRERRAKRFEHEFARLERERAAERELRLRVPVR